MTVEVTPVIGVSFDQNANRLTITEDAKEGRITLTVTAIYGHSDVPVVKTFVVTLTEERVPTTIDTQGVSLVLVPQYGEIIQSYTFTVRDQRERPVDNAGVSVTFPGNFPSGTSFVQNTLTVSSEADDCVIPLTLSFGSLTQAFDIHIKKAVITIDGPENISLSATETKTVSYTADITDSAGNSIDAELRWSISASGINSAPESGDIHITQWVQSQNAVITVTVNGYITGQKSIAITRLASSGGSSGGGGYRSAGISVSGVSLHAAEPVQPPAQKSPFSDLTEVKWAVEAIETLYKKGFLNGVSEGVFEPERSITRSEFVKLIAIIFELEAGGKKSVFADVAESDWYFDYVSAAYDAGIVSGNEEALFLPNQPISRQDMAKLLYGALIQAKHLSFSESMHFSDEHRIAGYAKDAAARLGGQGIFSGMPDGSFAPEQPATRAETAVVIYRALNIL